MTKTTMRTMTLVAGLAWLVVAGYGLRSGMVDDGDGWRVAYTIFNMALLVGTIISLGLAAWVTRESTRPRLRTAGLVVCGVGFLASIVGAWALPLWMTLLSAGLVVLMIAAAPPERRAVALLAAGQLIGMAVLLGGLILEIGRRDDYGDYPLAGGIALAVTAAITVVALLDLTRTSEALAPAPGGGGAGLKIGAVE